MDQDVPNRDYLDPEARTWTFQTRTFRTQTIWTQSFRTWTFQNRAFCTGVFGPGRFASSLFGQGHSARGLYGKNVFRTRTFCTHTFGPGRFSHSYFGPRCLGSGIFGLRRFAPSFFEHVCFARGHFDPGRFESLPDILDQDGSPLDVSHRTFWTRTSRSWKCRTWTFRTFIIQWLHCITFKLFKETLFLKINIGSGLFYGSVILSCISYYLDKERQTWYIDSYFKKIDDLCFIGQWVFLHMSKTYWRSDIIREILLRFSTAIDFIINEDWGAHFLCPVILSCIHVFVYMYLRWRSAFYLLRGLYFSTYSVC